MQKRNENKIASSQVQMENDDLNSKKVSIEVKDFSENDDITEKMFNLLNYILNSHI
jgi:hypothetical protein